MIKRVVSCALLSLSFASQAEIEAQAIALNCLTCHESDSGAAIVGTDIPSISGLKREKLRQTLLDFKYDRKSATLMSRIAKGYSDDELRRVTEFLTAP